MNLKPHFPIFNHHPDLVYLDSAATALKPQPVIDALTNYYTHYSANIHRGLYPIAEQATAAYESARATAAQFINASSPSEIIFTRSTTESLNLLAYSLTSHLTSQDTILTTHMEHHANLIPWQELAKRAGCQLNFIPLTSDYQLDLSRLPTTHSPLLTLSHVSNTLGTIVDLKSLIQLIKQHNPHIKVIVDGAQAIAHLPVDVQDLDCDAYVFSGHKLYGPTGIGVLWAKSELLEQLPPFNFGGDMIHTVNYQTATYQPAPSKFEAGTPHIAGAIGLAAAFQWFQEHCHPERSAARNEQTKSKDPFLITADANSLIAYTLDALQSIPGLTLYGPPHPVQRIGTFSFSIEKIHPHDLAQILGQSHICIRAGHHCTMPLHREILHVPATARISLGLHNTTQDIDTCIHAIHQAVKLLS